MKKNFDLYIKPTKNQKHDTDLLYIGLYLADDSTADPQYLVDSWKCITKALQPIKIEKQNLTPKKSRSCPFKFTMSISLLFFILGEGISTLYLYAIIGALAMFLLVAIVVIFLKVGRKSTNPYHKHPTDDAKPNLQNASNNYDSLKRPGGMNIYFSLEPKKQESHYEDININIWDHIYINTSINNS